METVKFDHQMFKLGVYKMLAGISEIDPGILKNHKQCRLGVWCDEGQGKRVFGQHPRFRSLDVPHAKVHDCAKIALEAAQQGDSESMRDALHSMEAASVEVGLILDSLLIQKAP
ncbi:MAG: CZB domain-containing protein [Azoarcus sp.]|nr:CZB domain-containing protein [Azoarcus sp.]